MSNNLITPIKIKSNDISIDLIHEKSTPSNKRKKSNVVDNIRRSTRLKTKSTQKSVKFLLSDNQTEITPSKSSDSSHVLIKNNLSSHFDEVSPIKIVEIVDKDYNRSGIQIYGVDWTLKDAILSVYPNDYADSIEIRDECNNVVDIKIKVNELDSNICYYIKEK